MSNLRTVAQQALDSINELFAAEQSEGGERGGHIRTPATREHLVRVAQARRALHESCDTLRAALAQQVEPLNLRDPAVRKRLATQWGYVPAAQAEPVQEPVAWNWMLDGLPYGRACYGDPPDADLAERAATAGRTVRLLYTAPPQRLPLTEEEIESCRQKGYAHAGLSAPFDFGKAARAVERAVWEKNHG